MNTEYKDRFWKYYWLAAALGLLLCGSIAALIFFTRATPPLEPVTPYAPETE